MPFILNVPSLNNMGFLPLFKGLLYFILEPLAVLALSLYGSVSFKTLNNGIFVIIFYIIGLAGGMAEQLGSTIKSEGLYKIGILSSLISPFDAIYRKMISEIFSSIGLTNPLFGPMSLTNTVPSTWMTVYTFLFMAVFIILSLREFSKKDIL